MDIVGDMEKVCTFVSSWIMTNFWKQDTGV